MVFASVVSSKFKTIDANSKVFPNKRGRASLANNSSLTGDTNTPELVATLQRKERMALNSMLAMIRARSRDNLKVWATVEPLGYHFKGYMQPATSSLLGAASCDLRTAWKRQDALYAECIPTFNETLQG